MDKIDRKIINSLQKNARASLKDLLLPALINSKNQELLMATIPQSTSKKSAFTYGLLFRSSWNHGKRMNSTPMYRAFPMWWSATV